MNLKNFSKLKDGSPQEVFREIAIKAVVRRYSVKEVFLKISQNPKENTGGRVLFLNEVTRFWAAILLEKRLRHRWFFCKLCEIFKNTIFTERLLATASVRFQLQ